MGCTLCAFLSALPVPVLYAPRAYDPTTTSSSPLVYRCDYQQTFIFASELMAGFAYISPPAEGCAHQPPFARRHFILSLRRIRASPHSCECAAECVFCCAKYSREPAPYATQPIAPPTPLPGCHPCNPAYYAPHSLL